MLGQLSQCGPLRTARDSKVGPTVLAKPAPHPSGPPLATHTPTHSGSGGLAVPPAPPGEVRSSSPQRQLLLAAMWGPCGPPDHQAKTRPSLLTEPPLCPTPFTCSRAVLSAGNVLTHYLNLVQLCSSFRRRSNATSFRKSPLISSAPTTWVPSSKPFRP